MRVRGHERERLVEALLLRVPHLAFEPFEAASSSPISPQATAFVDLQREPSGADPQEVVFTLTIVVSDGRAFDRRIETQHDDDEINRLLASTVANVLLAIEAGTIEADRGDVPLPTPIAPACPECECPQPPACPIPVVEPEVTIPEPVPPRIELGPVLAVSSVLGLGEPTEADRFAAAGATLGIHARLRRGALFGAELRGAGRGAEGGAGVARLRVALGAGYSLRREYWSLDTSVWGTVEPWWGRGGTTEPAPTPQWGLAVRVAPGLIVPGLADGRLTLGVGPTIELATSASLTTDGPRIGLIVIDDAGTSLGQLRVGGVELSTGLSATLWFGPRSRN